MKVDSDLEVDSRLAGVFNASDKHLVNLGWNSDNVNVDALRKVLTRKLARQRSSWTCAM